MKRLTYLECDMLVLLNRCRVPMTGHAISDRLIPAHLWRISRAWQRRRIARALERLRADRSVEMWFGEYGITTRGVQRLHVAMEWPHA